MRAIGVQIYTPTPAEMQQWQELGESFRKTDLVKGLVPAATINQALAAQK